MIFQLLFLVFALGQVTSMKPAGNPKQSKRKSNLNNDQNKENLIKWRSLRDLLYKGDRKNFKIEEAKLLIDALPVEFLNKQK